MRTDNRQNNQLWEAYQSSFRQFAKQASSLNPAQEQDELKLLALEEARAAYGRARDAVAVSLLESQGCVECACV